MTIYIVLDSFSVGFVKEKKKKSTGIHYNYSNNENKFKNIIYGIDIFYK